MSLAKSSTEVLLLAFYVKANKKMLQECKLRLYALTSVTEINVQKTSLHYHASMIMLKKKNTQNTRSSSTSGYLICPWRQLLELKICRQTLGRWVKAVIWKPLLGSSWNTGITSVSLGPHCCACATDPHFWCPPHVDVPRESSKASSFSLKRQQHLN